MTGNSPMPGNSVMTSSAGMNGSDAGSLYSGPSNPGGMNPSNPGMNPSNPGMNPSNPGMNPMNGMNNMMNNMMTSMGGAMMGMNPMNPAMGKCMPMVGVFFLFSFKKMGKRMFRRGFQEVYAFGE